MSMDINKINCVVYNQPKDSTVNKGVGTLIKSIRSESKEFLDRDLVQELNQSVAKNPKDEAKETVKFLKSIETDLKNTNSKVSTINSIGKEYAKLLHNQHHLGETFYKIQEQTVLNTLREGNDKTINNLSIEKKPSTQSDINIRVNNNPQTPYDAIPSGAVRTPNTINTPIQNTPQFNIEKPTTNYQLAPSPDIFSAPKNGGNVTYKIVPFDFMAGT
jgi:hypothetical protein